MREIPGEWIPRFQSRRSRKAVQDGGSGELSGSRGCEKRFQKPLAKSETILIIAAPFQAEAGTEQEKQLRKQLTRTTSGVEYAASIDRSNAL